MKLPLARTENIIVQSAGQELLIYDLLTHKIYCLNETSRIVFESCDGKTTFDELKNKQKLIDDIIFLALDELNKQNLLIKDSGYLSPLTNISRRKAIRRIGVASIAALPTIVFLVAPVAAAQNSCVNIGGLDAGQPIILAPGVAIRYNGTNCSGTPDSTRSSFCNSLLHGECCNNIALYSPGSCMDTSPFSFTYSCICG